MWVVGVGLCVFHLASYLDLDLLSESCRVGWRLETGLGAMMTGNRAPICWLS